MVLLQQMEKLNLSTFGDVSKHLLKRILPSVNGTTYFVTDQYLPGSRHLKDQEEVKVDPFDLRLKKEIRRGQSNGQSF